MSEEVKLFQRYMRLNKKLAYGKNEKKQKRIVAPLFKREDYGTFDYSNGQNILKDDLEIFKTYASFDVESLDSEAIRKQLKI